MKRTAFSMLMCFVCFLFYCEGIDVLLKKTKYVFSADAVLTVNPKIVCKGDINSILEPNIACEEIKEDLAIRNTTLHTLEIYSTIEIVNGSVLIENNNLLNNINGLQQIKYVEKDFIINDNVRLIEAEVRRVILKILNDNKGYIGGNIIFNHSVLDLEVYVIPSI